MFPARSVCSASDAVVARVQALGDGLDGAAFAGGVAAFEDHQQALAAAVQAALQADQFELQFLHRLAIVLAHGCLARSAALRQVKPFRRDGMGSDVAERLQLVGLVLAGQRVDQFVEVALQDLGKLVQGEVDAVVGDAGPER